uniref:Keratin-associated protein 5-4-like isoform X2 n=1 Tax=Geotrypetes seraphini TaxID=260995 RepID=A0A6P8NYD7_GEOSA|nr:keratin-associated protein 5-4-like isoform X2 [Geotrypetes seraphini]
MLVTEVFDGLVYQARKMLKLLLFSALLCLVAVASDSEAKVSKFVSSDNSTSSSSEEFLIQPCPTNCSETNCNSTVCTNDGNCKKKEKCLETTCGKQCVAALSPKSCAKDTDCVHGYCCQGICKPHCYNDKKIWKRH